MIKAIPACRICESRELTSLIDLGEQYLTGIFPATPNQPLTRGTLELIKCDLCGLVQLRHSYLIIAAEILLSGALLNFGRGPQCLPLG